MIKTTRPKSLSYKSFESSYKKLALPIMKFIIKRMGTNSPEAEEIFSQTMIAAWQGWLTFEHKSSYFTWICRIALNKIADYYRKEINNHSRLIAPTLEEIANIGDPSITIDESLALLELRQSVRECLNLLPEHKRQLLYLRFWKELTYSEIAKLLNQSNRSIEGKLYRYKIELKKILISKYPELIAIKN